MSDQPGPTSGSSSLQARLRGPAGALAVDMVFEVRSSWAVVFGPSGAGKSTVLRALCGLTHLQEQHVILHGTDLTHLPPHRRRIAMVAQAPALFPHMTALENVLFAMQSDSQHRRSARAEQARSLLDRFQAGAAVDKHPGALSGGEKQRVALARAVASSPRLLLLDEAFTGLQTELRSELIDEVKQWQRESGVPVLSVTHDVAEALACATEVLRMADGRLLAQGRPFDVLAEERERLQRALREPTGALYTG